MKKILFPLLLLTSYFTFSQNLILNPDFEAGSPQYYNNCGTNNSHCQEAKNFDANLNEWKGRLKIHEQLWHSPDWHYDHPYNKKIGVKTYELVQQKLDEKISANEFYIIKFRMKWEAYISDNIKFQFYLSKKKMKYKKESLSIFQSEKNHLCSERYKSLRGYEYQVESFSNLPFNPNIISQWFDIELYFQAPDNSNLDWFGFQLVEKSPAVIPDNPDDVNDAGDCIIGYLYIDDVELKKQPEGQEQCSSDPCSPTDGSIHASYPEQVDNHSNVIVTELDNVKSATNIKIRTIHGQLIEKLDDRYCINGIDTMVWNGLNLAHGVYIWQMTLENDCGEQNYWKGFQYANDNLPIKYFDKACNNSIQTPIPCCESEPDIYIEEETIEGPGELSFHAINNIEVENTTVEANTENLEMKAGNEIRLKPGTHIHQGAYAHFYIEPCATTNTHEALLSETTYSIPFAEVQDEKTENELEGDKFSIYPNPFSSELHLSISSDYGNQLICEIYDLNGVLVFNETFNCRFSHCLETINTAHLKSGMYIVKLTGSDDIKSFKIIKQ